MWRWLLKQTVEILSEIKAGEIMAVIVTLYAVSFGAVAIYVASNFGVIWGAMVLPLSIIPILILTIATKLAISKFTKELKWLGEDVEEKLYLMVDDKTISQGNEQASLDLSFVLNVINKGNRKIIDLDAHLSRIDQITEDLPLDTVNDISTSYMKRLQWEDESYVTDLKPGVRELKKITIAILDCYNQQCKFIHEGKSRVPRVFREDAIYRIFVEFKGKVEGDDSVYKYFQYETGFVCSPKHCILDSPQEVVSNLNLPDGLKRKLANKTTAKPKRESIETRLTLIDNAIPRITLTPMSLDTKSGRRDIKIHNNESMKIVLTDISIGHTEDDGRESWACVSPNKSVPVEPGDFQTMSFITEEKKAARFYIRNHIGNGDSNITYYNFEKHDFLVRITYNSTEKREDSVVKFFDVTVNHNKSEYVVVCAPRIEEHRIL